MTTVLITVAVFATAMIFLSLGVILANKPLAGSCGGLGALRKVLGLGPCESCAEDPEAQKDKCSRARKEADRRREEMDV
ncbi:MAG: hypothetical protein CMJ83_07025 [Planctomycetes bacterium]|nr:hypothetical protein [Planctomycetota bacterium]